MCGRFCLFEDENEDIREILNRTEGEFKTGEIFPTDKAPVLLRQQNETSPVAIKWGFPGFKGKGVIINARAETVEQKKIFRNCLQTGRCVISSTGFYEWTHDGKKQKYRFNLPGTGVLYMAGLFNVYNGERRFVILTTSTNDSMPPVHNRMPVILSRDEVRPWLGLFQKAQDFLYSKRPELVKQIS